MVLWYIAFKLHTYTKCTYLWSIKNVQFLGGHQRLPVILSCHIKIDMESFPRKHSELAWIFTYYTIYRNRLPYLYFSICFVFALMITTDFAYFLLLDFWDYIPFCGHLLLPIPIPPFFHILYIFIIWNKRRFSAKYFNNTSYNMATKPWTAKSYVEITHFFFNPTVTTP